MRTAFIQALFVQLGLGLSVDGLMRRTNSEVGVFNNPGLTPFLQLDLAIGFETNVSAPNSLGVMAPNVKGGKASGAFEAEILALGASWEKFILDAPEETSLYKNLYILQTASNDTASNGTVSLEVDVVLNYRNNALHGFGSGKFATDIPDLMDINYNSYLFEVAGDFATGEAFGQVFALNSGSRRDGKPIKALLPLGGS
ncbi:hypothetical protein F53441_5698 [Fusarium austroafricanum]|uniref:Uncharacterized protein n=1 Tax=Fusarium austroafricanum TaxID=2364996 RepID=A0A8H4P7X6_9HYPO|nr:hypothetical protein F53441_5698 [Fusarium austroafricanum]